MKHTPTPWYEGYKTRKGNATIFGHDTDGNIGIPVIICDKGTLAQDIDLVIKAVNNHEKLLNALKEAKSFLERNQEHIPESQDAEEIYFLIQDTIEESEEK